jgi:hypothetical protein
LVYFYGKSVFELYVLGVLKESIDNSNDAKIPVGDNKFSMVPPKFPLGEPKIPTVAVP